MSILEQYWVYLNIVPLLVVVSGDRFAPHDLPHWIVPWIDRVLTTALEPMISAQVDRSFGLAWSAAAKSPLNSSLADDAGLGGRNLGK